VAHRLQENVADVIVIVRRYGVDACFQLETHPGLGDIDHVDLLPYTVANIRILGWAVMRPKLTPVCIDVGRAWLQLLNDVNSQYLRSIQVYA
jgi:hypothetical protein